MQAAGRSDLRLEQHDQPPGRQRKADPQLSTGTVGQLGRVVGAAVDHGARAHQPTEPHRGHLTLPHPQRRHAARHAARDIAAS